MDFNFFGKNNIYGQYAGIAAIILILIYGGYLLYKSIQKYNRAKDLKKNHFDSKIVDSFSDSNFWLIMYIVMCIIGVVGMVASVSQNQMINAGAFLFITLYSVSLLFEVRTARAIYFSKDSLLYGDMIVKFSNVRDIDEKGSIFKRYEIRTRTQAEPLRVPRRIGNEVKIRMEEYHSRRKHTYRR